MKIEKIKYKITSYIFVIFLVGMAAAIVILPKQSISRPERRKLAQKPEITMENIKNESFMNDLESYLLDHFPSRQTLRKLKAYFAYNILGQRENNDIYIADGHASKLEYPLNEKSVERAAQKMLSLQAKYFPDEEVYYAIIPDKNYFLADKNGYPVMNYQKMVEILSDKLLDFTYIDIFDTLTIEDYYFTDTHWKQESLFDTAEKVSKQLGVFEKLDLDKNNFSVKEIKDFYGVYYGQSALTLDADTIKYLTNEVIDGAKVWNIETQLTKPVYELDKLENPESVDMYDIFLGGAAALQIIENPNATEKKELIIFRDSYTSSLAPLLIEAYSKIILVDLRYISSELIGDYVDFDGTQVLFLYNTSIINNSSMLK